MNSDSRTEGVSTFTQRLVSTDSQAVTLRWATGPQGAPITCSHPAKPTRRGHGPGDPSFHLKQDSL